MVNRIGRARFEALAVYIRGPQSVLISRELEWYEDEKGRVLGVLMLDLADEDFAGVVLGRDARRRFRAVTVSAFSDSRDTARASLEVDLDTWSRMPDTEFWQFWGDVFVEAVTVNPTTNLAGIVIEPDVPLERHGFKEYYQEYMPIKWGSPLTSKLKKAYWNLPHVKGKPIVFAIQDFHVPRAMTFLSHSLPPYLYGVSFTALYDENERLIVKATSRGPHTWGFKTIESGFFNLPGSGNVSAVLANPTATISKFNRMAYVAGLGSRALHMICVGSCHDHDDNAALPKRFKFVVNDPRYSETWVEGANVYHNPNALVPLDDSFLPGAAHHHFENRQIRSSIPRFHPYESETVIVAPDRIGEGLQTHRLGGLS